MANSRTHCCIPAAAFGRCDCKRLQQQRRTELQQFVTLVLHTFRDPAAFFGHVAIVPTPSADYDHDSTVYVEFAKARAKRIAAYKRRDEADVAYRRLTRAEASPWLIGLATQERCAARDAFELAKAEHVKLRNDVVVAALGLPSGCELVNVGFRAKHNGRTHTIDYDGTTAKVRSHGVSDGRQVSHHGTRTGRWSSK